MTVGWGQGVAATWAVGAAQQGATASPASGAQAGPAFTPAAFVPGAAAPGQVAPGQVAPAADAQPVRSVPLAAGRSDGLGQQVLDTLERFGTRVRQLQDLGTFDPKHPGGSKSSSTQASSLPPGPAARPIVPVQATTPAASPSAPDGMDAVKAQYDAIFGRSMADQARLYGLVTEVTLGHSVASSTNSTAKTLLTQSG